MCQTNSQIKILYLIHIIIYSRIKFTTFIKSIRPNNVPKILIVIVLPKKITILAKYYKNKWHQE